MRVVAKADDLERDRRQQFEIGIRLDLLAHATSEADMAIDHLLVAIATVGLQRRPYRQRSGPARELGAAITEVGRASLPIGR